MFKFSCRVAALFACAHVHAATCTWTGNGVDGKWSRAANWDTCVGVRTVPINTDTLIFPDGAARKTNTNDLVALQLSAMQLNGLNYDIDGNAITLSLGISVNTPLGLFSDFGPRFRPGITLSNTQTCTCAAGKFLYLDGALNLNGKQLAIDGPCNTALRGAISGDGQLTKFGTGSLYMQTGPYSYTGPTEINAGTIYAGSDSGLGATDGLSFTTVQDNGTLALYLGVTIGEPIYLGGGTLENFIGDNTITGFVSFNLSGTVDVAAGTTLTLAGQVVGLNMTKAGAGTLVLANTTGVDSVISAGTVEVDATTGAVTVDSGGTLAGDGALTDAAQLLGGGTIAPGRSATPGTLAGTSLLWYGDSAFRMRLGTKSDRLTLGNALTKVGSGAYEFKFRDGATPPVVGSTYTLIEYSSQGGFGSNNLSFSYVGTGPGTNLTGFFTVSSTSITFTVVTVTSDLIFRDGME